MAPNESIRNYLRWLLSPRPTQMWSYKALKAGYNWGLERDMQASFKTTAIAALCRIRIESG